jgi:hypothetical protein
MPCAVSRAMLSLARRKPPCVVRCVRLWNAFAGDIPALSIERSWMSHNAIGCGATRECSQCAGCAPLLKVPPTA